MDDRDPNYKVYVSVLMMAKALGSKVTLYADVGEYDRCKIGYITMY